MPRKAILCVDDEEMILTSLKDQLRNHFKDSYQYEFAESADEAMEVVEELHEDGMEVLIIVSDWLMPGMKGDEFLTKVHERFPNIVTVLLTGQADETAVDRTRRRANLHRCLYKPWSEKDLIETLVSGLEKT